jgi:hypothetical protein
LCLQKIEAIELSAVDGENGLDASLINANIFHGLVNRLLEVNLLIGVCDRELSIGDVVKPYSLVRTCTQPSTGLSS